VSAWNPSQIDQMALPPCHYSFQFNVDPAPDGRPLYLNCLVNMRSTDTFCGLPFNIASYALLTHIVAHITKLRPGKLTISMCDMHLYENAIEQAKTQIQRTPKRFPSLTFSDGIHAIHDPSINDFAFKMSIDDVIVHGYVPDSYIKVNMVV
jgi:thymidylate synthase